MATNVFRSNVERVKRTAIGVEYNYKAGDLFELYRSAMQAENAAMQLAEQLREHVSQQVNEVGMVKRYYDLDVPSFLKV